MFPALTEMKGVQFLKAVAFAPVLAALLLGSLPVLLAMGICRLTKRCPLSTQ